MRGNYFLFVISLLVIGLIIHNKIECQNVTSVVNVVWESDDENGNENDTDVTKLNSTTATTITKLNSATAVTSLPTNPPKRKHRDGLQCPPLPLNRLKNGKIRLLPNAKVQFVCKRGYRLIGPSVIRCFQGNWSSEIKPRCILPYSSCGPPEPVPHGTVYGNDWTDGSRILYICNSGYVLLGSRERTCERGYWSAISPICQVEVEPLPDVAARLKDQFVDKVGDYSSDSRGRSIGSDIQHTGLELFLLIDKSSSVDPVDFKIGIKFAKFLVDEFGVQNGANDKNTGTRIGVVTFAEKANLVIKPDDASIRNKEDAKNRLDSLKPEGGGTSINQALVTVVQEIGSLRPAAKKAIFLLTDGHNNVPMGKVTPREIAKNLKDNDIEIFAVGIGRDINKDELNSIASEPVMNHVFLLDRFSDLGDIMWLIRSSPDEAPPKDLRTCETLPKLEGKNFKEDVSGWPWLAVIYVKHPPKRNHSSYRMGICSGSLICSRWVLTSASCFYGEDKSVDSSKSGKAFVTLGEDDLSREDGTETNFRISRLFSHPKFHPWNGTDYDVALVKLKKAAPMELNYRPICLPTGDQLIAVQKNENAHGFMAGWGTVPSDIFFDGNFASSFKILPEVTKMPIVDDNKCNRIKAMGSTNTFCAGSRIRRICSGNLGSPIVVEDTDSKTHYIIGVLNSRKYCNSDYNIFTDISRHVAWINNVTSNCQKFR